MKKVKVSDFLENVTMHGIKKRVWFVAVIWRPNAGKSTFLNTLIGEKISITSNIPQTTRNKIIAIYNTPDSQIIFLDTPGIHLSEKKFNEEITARAKSAVSDANVVLHFVDGSRKLWDEEKALQEMVANIDKPIITVYTKADLPQKNDLDSQYKWIKISSETQDWFNELLMQIYEFLEFGPQLYPDDMYTQQKLFFRVSEIIREKAFFYVKEELPHSIFVQVEDIHEDSKLYKISSYIYVETDSQKYIVIGKQGSLIQKISTESRIDLEKILWKKVFLTVRVKVRKNWRKDEHLIKKLLQ